MNKIMQSSILRLFLIVAVVIGASSCKKNKKLSELSDPQAEKEKIEQEMEEELETEEEPIPIKVKPKVLSSEQKLNNYFDAIASASSTTAANNSINEALSMFSTPDAPLLIIFYEANGKESYDSLEGYTNINIAVFRSC